MRLPKKVLIVEDEIITQKYLKNILSNKDDCDITLCDNAHCVKNLLKLYMYDLILMDINIKGSQDGISLAKYILQHYNIAIVFISAYSDENTLEEVVELSPYGFITKPFSSKEVVATISIAYQRFLTHTNTYQNYTDTININHIYSYNTNTRTLYERQKAIKLNTKQHQLICILINNINNTVSCEEITSQIWQDRDISPSSLRTLVYSIRKLLPDLPIQTYSKVGYSITQI